MLTPPVFGSNLDIEFVVWHGVHSLYVLDTSFYRRYCRSVYFLPYYQGSLYVCA